MPVICGTDFSENAQHAVRVAVVFARALKESLLLVHVVEDEVAAVAGEFVESWSNAAQARLEEIAQSLRSVGLKVEARVVQGTPDEKIAEIGETLGGSLLVVGFLGRRSAVRWRAGSLPARLAHATMIPVIVVRDAAGFEASARGERPLRVLLAADFSLASDAAVGWLDTLRRLGPSEITLLHGYDPVREWSRLRVPGRASIGGSAEIEAILMRDLKARTAGLLGDETASHRAVPSLDWTAETVARVAEQEGFDVVVVGGHRRRGFARIAHDSISQRLLELAPASVVRIPLNASSMDARGIPRIASILAPTDLSELGNNATLYAYAIAPPGGTVHLLHVVEEAPLPNPLYAHYSPGRRASAEERAALHRDLETALRALVPQESERRGIETRVHVVHDGEPADVIRTIAEREGVDSICMGTHGRSGLSRLFGGSVAREIASKSPRPLYLVHPAATD